MSQKRTTTRSRLLSLGLDALSAEGLAGLTLGSLATDAQMSKSGLFAHFRSKEQLQLELLEEAAKLADAQVPQCRPKRDCPACAPCLPNG
jgi:AcrR family transcriptional regulator